jgi:uncharacterized membrane protein YphA (DoxX/SURF4 family)
MRRATELALRILLGAVFVWAGLSKVGSPLATLATVYSYQITMPDQLAEAIAAALPWLEILVGLALLSGLLLRAALVWTVVLLVGFAALTGQAWWRDLPIDCGCMDLGALHPALDVLATPGGATLRNLALLLLAGLLGALVRARMRVPAP